MCRSSILLQAEHGVERDAFDLLFKTKFFAESESVVRYTLPEGNTQIFASKYKLYLPSDEELRAELQREYRALDEAQAGE